MIRLRASVAADYPVARRGAQRLWELLQSDDVVHPDPSRFSLNPGPQTIRQFSGAFELTTAAIEDGAAGLHFEDQLSAPERGHPGAKILIPTGSTSGRCRPPAWPPTSSTSRRSSSPAPARTRRPC